MEPAACAAAPPEALHLPPAALDTLMPFHLRIDPAGRVLGVGRSLARLLPGLARPRAAAFDHLAVTRPERAETVAALARLAGRRLRLEGRGDPPVRLRGTAITTGEGLLLAVSLGSEMAEIVARAGLKERDFPPHDVSVEMLYLLETQAEILREAKALNARLDAARREAERRAVTDPVTGLANRSGLAEALSARLARADGPPVGLLAIDLDGFKSVNDSFGHATGDAVLRHVGRLIAEEAGDGGVVARVGGDEFVAVVDAATGRPALRALAARVLARVAEPIDLAGQSCRIGASIGAVLHVPLDGATGEGAYRPGDAERMLTDADLALYESKRSGRGRVGFFAPELRVRFETHARLAAELRESLSRGAFEPMFQPQIDARTGALVGLEVLARWRHPRLGLLPPGRFFPAATEAHLLDAIDDLVTERAFEAARGWTAAGLSPPKISFNVTASRLARPGLVEEFLWAAERADLPPQAVAIEIHESIMLDRRAAVTIAGIEALAAAGFRIELDDFGTGHAAISSLRVVPVDAVKIDRSFVTGIDRDATLRTLTGGILHLLHALRISAIAEGVETEAEMGVMRDLGCALFQGFRIARPMPASAVPGWLVSVPHGPGRRLAGGAAG